MMSLHVDFSMDVCEYAHACTKLVSYKHMFVSATTVVCGHLYPCIVDIYRSVCRCI